MLKDDTLKYLYEKTKNYENGKNNKIFTAQYISELFKVKRNTISHYINQMIEDGEVIKVNTRPVYFFHKRAFEETFFKVSKNVFSSLDELFFREDEGEKVEEVFDKLIGISGSLWGKTYSYAMCVLEEMQWIKTKSIQAPEYFHGTLEIVEDGTCVVLLRGEDETRVICDRVENFTKQHSSKFTIFDTKDYVTEGISDEFRGLCVKKLLLET